MSVTETKIDFNDFDGDFDALAADEVALQQLEDDCDGVLCEEVFMSKHEAYTFGILVGILRTKPDSSALEASIRAPSAEHVS